MTLNRSKVFRLEALLNLRTFIIGAGVLLLVWLSLVFGLGLEQQTMFLPGTTSDGHALFEASCASCHEGFQPVSNDTCMHCHEAELAADVHGTSKFRDPRWAEYLQRLDALTCTACHNEHVHMFGRGVHLQPDLCMACHQGIIQGDLQSHTGFDPDGCWTAGCHNFHDHRSISTGFLRDNLDQPPMLPVPTLPARLVTTQADRPPLPDLEAKFLEGQS